MKNSKLAVLKGNAIEMPREGVGGGIGLFSERQKMSSISFKKTNDYCIGFMNKNIC